MSETLQPEKEKPECDIVRKVVRHDGDCSCYRWDSRICDCGALREKVREGNFDGDDETWTAWAIHQGAVYLSANPNSPPLGISQI